MVAENVAFYHLNLCSFALNKIFTISKPIIESKFIMHFDSFIPPFFLKKNFFEFFNNIDDFFFVVGEGLKSVQSYHHCSLRQEKFSLTH